MFIMVIFFTILQRTIPEANQARDSGIHLIAVTLENTGDNLEIRGIANNPDEKNTFSVRRYSELPNIINQVVLGMCNSELLREICRNRNVPLSMLLYKAFLW